MTIDLWALIGAAVSLIGLVWTPLIYSITLLNKRLNRFEDSMNARFTQTEERTNERFDGIETQLKELRQEQLVIRDRISSVEGSLNTLLQVFDRGQAA